MSSEVERPEPRPRISSVCVYCGSVMGRVAAYREAAEALGTHLAIAGVEIVYGGGAVGLMGVMADAALAAGGRVVGVLPRGLFEREVCHTGLSELHEVASMHERKQLMLDLADAFVALPGGLGTLEEVAEAATWAQLGIHRKPVALVGVDGFWDPLLAQLDRAVESGLLSTAGRRLVMRVGHVDHVLAALGGHVAGPRTLSR